MTKKRWWLQLPTLDMVPSMGAPTGKVLDYATKSKTCRVCSTGKGKKNTTVVKTTQDLQKSWSHMLLTVDLFKDLVMYNIYT